MADYINPIKYTYSMIKVYKEFDAIQWNGENTNEITSKLNVINIIGIDKSSLPPQPDTIIVSSQEGNFTIKVSNWLVYSPYKDQWKVYADEEFQSTFKTLEQVSTYFNELEKERIDKSFVSIPDVINAFQWIEINQTEIQYFMRDLSDDTQCGMGFDLDTKDNDTKLYIHTYTYTDIGRHLEFELNPSDWLVYDCVKQSFNKYINSGFEAILRFIK